MDFAHLLRKAIFRKAIFREVDSRPHAGRIHTPIGIRLVRRASAYGFKCQGAGNYMNHMAHCVSHCVHPVRKSGAANLPLDITLGEAIICQLVHLTGMVQQVWAGR